MALHNTNGLFRCCLSKLALGMCALISCRQPFYLRRSRFLETLVPATNRPRYMFVLSCVCIERRWFAAKACFCFFFFFFFYIFLFPPCLWSLLS
jgi:hypothetical protein